MLRSICRGIFDEHLRVFAWSGRTTRRVFWALILSDLIFAFSLMLVGVPLPVFVAAGSLICLILIGSLIRRIRDAGYSLLMLIPALLLSCLSGAGWFVWVSAAAGGLEMERDAYLALKIVTGMTVAIWTHVASTTLTRSASDAPIVQNPRVAAG